MTNLKPENLILRRNSFEGAALEVSQRLPKNIYQKLAKTVSPKQNKDTEREREGRYLIASSAKTLFWGENENRFKLDTAIKARDLPTMRLVEMSLGHFLISSTSLR